MCYLFCSCRGVRKEALPSAAALLSSQPARSARSSERGAPILSRSRGHARLASLSSYRKDGRTGRRLGELQKSSCVFSCPAAAAASFFSLSQMKNSLCCGSPKNEHKRRWQRARMRRRRPPSVSTFPDKADRPCLQVSRVSCLCVMESGAIPT